MGFLLGLHFAWFSFCLFKRIKLADGKNTEYCEGWLNFSTRKVDMPVYFTHLHCLNSTVSRTFMLWFKENSSWNINYSFRAERSIINLYDSKCYNHYLNQDEWLTKSVLVVRLHLLLKNYWANLNQIWYVPFIGWRDFMTFHRKGW